MIPYQTLEEPLGCGAVVSGLKKQIKDLAVPKALRGAGSPGLKPAIDSTEWYRQVIVE